MRSLINLLLLRGWISFLFFVITALSTLLNILQVFNGVICFSVLDSSSRISKVDTTRISLPASVIDSNGLSTAGLCNSPEYLNIKSNFALKCGFNESYRYGSFDCLIEGKKPRGEIRRAYRFGCDCRAPNEKVLYSQSTLTATENSAIYMDSEYVKYDGSSNYTGFFCYMNVERGICTLNSEFYRSYLIFSVMLVFSLYITRIILHGALSGFISYMYSFWWLRPVLNFLRRKNFLVYCSWWVDFRHTCKRIFILSDAGEFQPQFDHTLEYTLFTPKVKINAVSIDELNLFEVEFDGDVSQVYYKNDMKKWCLCREILTRCVEEKIPIVSIECKSHQLDPLEVIELIYKGKFSNYHLDSNGKNELFGFKIFPLGERIKEKANLIESISDEKKSLLEAHNKAFFGQHRPFLLNRALNSNFKPEILDIKNSEWKIYISDVKHHILQIRTGAKKYGKSKSLLSIEGNDDLIREKSECSSGLDLKNSLKDYFRMRTGRRISQLKEKESKENMLKKLKESEEASEAGIKRAKMLKEIKEKEKMKFDGFKARKLKREEDEEKDRENMNSICFEKPLEEILEVKPLVGSCLVEEKPLSFTFSIFSGMVMPCKSIKRIDCEMAEKFPGLEICEWCHSNKYEREIIEDFNFIIDGDLKEIYNSERDLVKKMSQKWEDLRKWFYKANIMGPRNFRDHYGEFIANFSNWKIAEELEIKKREEEEKAKEEKLKAFGEEEDKSEKPIEKIHRLAKIEMSVVKEIIKEVTNEIKVKTPREMSKTRGGLKSFKGVVKEHVRNLATESLVDFNYFKIGLSKQNKEGISLKSFGFTKKSKNNVLSRLEKAAAKEEKMLARKKEKDSSMAFGKKVEICQQCGFNVEIFLEAIRTLKEAKCKSVRNPNPEWVKGGKERRRLAREEKRKANRSKW